MLHARVAGAEVVGARYGDAEHCADPVSGWRTELEVGGDGAFSVISISRLCGCDAGLFDNVYVYAPKCSGWRAGWAKD